MGWNEERTDSNESEYFYHSNETNDTTIDDTKLKDCINQTNMKIFFRLSEITHKLLKKCVFRGFNFTFCLQWYCLVCLLQKGMAQ